MPTAICPTNQQLESFLLGLGAEDDAQFIEEHLARCSDCLEKLNALDREDPLTHLARKQATPAPHPHVDNSVQAIMEELKRLCIPGANVGETFAFFQDASTLHGIFDVPQGDNEIGRLESCKIIRLVGSGGMGMVFQAHETILDRPVAIKILRPSAAGDRNARERFLAEARAVASLEHDHIVSIHQVGEKEGIPYFVMPYLQGESLADRIEREGSLPESEIRRIGGEIARGLAAAHQRGLIHRDIKPANIWLEAETGRIKILDFGLVRQIQEDVRKTHLGIFVGTPLFMAPEQADGGPIDTRCDLFSLGSVLYVLCTGEVPFPGENILGVMHSVCNDLPLPIAKFNPNISQALIDIIEKLHAKNPQDRFASADEVAGRLEESKDERPKRPARKLVPVIAAAILLVCLGTIAVWAGKLLDQDQSSSRTTNPLQNKPQENGNLVIQKQENANNVVPAKKRPAVYPIALFAFAERGREVKGKGSKVRDLLFAELAARPELILVEREDIQKVLGELQLNLSGAVKPADATRVGQLTGAKLQISGSVLQVDKQIYLVAQIVGTETTRQTGTSVHGKEPLDELVAKLAKEIAATIKKKANSLVAQPVPEKDRFAALKAKLGKARRPSVLIQIKERIIGGTTMDPAAATELAKTCKETGFTVLDPETAVIASAEVLIKGEAFCEAAARRGGLISVKARVELRAIEQKSGKILASDSQTAIAIDLTEQIAGKAALQEAAARLAQRVLPKIVGGRK